MERFPPLRRNDRTAKLGSEPLDSCGVLRGIPHLGSLGSVLRARRFRVLGYQPPHTVEVESKPSDGSLRLESLDRVYATFLHLVSFHFPEKEREPERNELRSSRSRILEQSYPLSGRVRERVEKERGDL